MEGAHFVENREKWTKLTKNVQKPKGIANNKMVLVKFITGWRHLSLLAPSPVRRPCVSSLHVWRGAIVSCLLAIWSPIAVHSTRDPENVAGCKFSICLSSLIIFYWPHVFPALSNTPIQNRLKTQQNALKQAGVETMESDEANYLKQ